MTSGYFETRGRALDAPVTAASLEEAYRDDEGELTDSINKDIDRVNDEDKSMYQLLINQNNKMFDNQVQIPKTLLNLTQSGLKAQDNLNNYLEETKPIRNWHQRRREAEDYAKNGTKYKWLKDLTIEELAALKGGNYSLADSDVRKFEKLENYRDDVNVEVQHQAWQLYKAGQIDEANELFAGAKGEDGIGTSEKDSVYYATEEAFIRGYDDFLEQANGSFLMQSGEMDPTTGMPKLINLADTGSLAESQQILDEILYRYTNSFPEHSRGIFGRLKRDVWEQLARKNDARMVLKQNLILEATKEAQIKKRSDLLKNKTKSVKSYLSKHIKENAGAHDGDLGLARKELVNSVSTFAKNGYWNAEEINDALDDKFWTNDGRYVSFEDNWPKDAAKIRKGLGEYQAEEIEAITEKKEVVLTEDAIKIKAEIDGSDKPLDERSKIQIVSQYMKRHNIKMEQVPDILKDLPVIGEGDDEMKDFILTERYLQGQQIQSSDLQGFATQEKKKEWIDRIKNPGPNATSRKSFITGAVNQKTLETDGQKDKSMKWRAYENNAISAYNNAFLNEIAAGGTVSNAEKAAQKAVLDGLQIGKEGDTNWSEWGGVLQGRGPIMELSKAKEGIMKDPTLISSDQPLPGEEPSIKQALDYLNKKAVQLNIPIYYRQFPQIKRLPNGQLADPYRLMMHRLESLGLLKDNKPLPEDKLPDYLQKLLLNKPSPNKTLRVINEEDGINLIDAELFDQRGRNAAQALIDNAQKSQQYAVLDGYNQYKISPVIPPDLDEEWTAVVDTNGDLHWSNKLKFLQPEVAKAFVADVLMT